MELQREDIKHDRGLPVPDLTIRAAGIDDLRCIVEMLADDDLGSGREDWPSRSIVDIWLLFEQSMPIPTSC